MAIIASKLGIKKTKNVVLVINLSFLGIFGLYTLFSSFSYYVIVILLLIPILFYPTKKFHYLTTLFCFIAAFAVPVVQMGVDNSFRLDIFLLMIALLLYSIFPLIILGDLEKEKFNKQAQKTKLKFYRLKQSRASVYLVLGIWLCFEAFFAYAYVLSESSRDIFGFLALTIFFAIIFLPAIVIVYRKLVDIEIDARKIVTIEKGKRKEIRFENINSARIKGEVGEGFSPFKEPVLGITGKENTAINLSKYSSKDFKILKDMLYTYIGEKFKDKKV